VCLVPAGASAPCARVGFGGPGAVTLTSSHATRLLPGAIAMLTACGQALWPALLLAAAACHGASAFTSAPPFTTALLHRAHFAARQHGAERRRGRSALSMVQTPPRASVSIKELSKQMKTARLDMAAQRCPRAQWRGAMQLRGGGSSEGDELGGVVAASGWFPACMHPLVSEDVLLPALLPAAVFLP